MIDLLVLLNYVIFAIVFSLFLIELGTAILILFDYKDYRKRTSSYIAPIWEITGTFSIFYVVNAEATFPGLLVPAGILYIAPILVAGAFLIFRDVFLGYSEFIKTGKSEVRYARVYGVCTVVFMFLLLSVLTSTVTGAGVDLPTGNVSLFLMLFNPFNLLMFISVIALVIFAASIFFEVRNPTVQVLSIFISVIVLLFAVSTYVPDIFVNILNNSWYIFPPFILLILIMVMHANRHEYTKAITLAWLILSVLTFELLEYPFLFGGQVNILSTLTPSVNRIYIGIFSLLGGLFLAAAIGYFIKIHSMHRKLDKTY